MALTPEDVIGKTFQPTRFQEGYNQDEVDDFLDEVVLTLRGLRKENEDLRTGLDSCRTRVSELLTGQAGAADTVIAVPVTGDGSEDTAVSAAGFLALAQRLHDEHIAAGRRQHDAMIAEAQSRAASLVADAEQVCRDTMNSLEHERDRLQTWIDSLRDFEREYRSRLRAFLQAQLGDLDSQADLEPQPSGVGHPGVGHPGR